MTPSPDASRLLSFLLAEKSIRGAILDGSGLIREMQRRHGTGTAETLILGQAVLMTALMASGLKGRDEIGLRIDCSGPVKGLVAEGTATGDVRGYLKQNPIPLPPLHSFSAITALSPYWQDGFLTITRYLEEAKQPFTGSIALQSGDIAAETARYYRLSEQLPTAIHLGVSLDLSGEVAGAGGLLLQAMPGAEGVLFTTLEQKTRELPSLGLAISEGRDIAPWLLEQYSDYRPDILEEKPVSYRCRCNDLRMRLLLQHLPLADLEDIRDHGPFPVLLTCHFCNREYPFDQRAVSDIYREKQAQLPVHNQDKDE